MKDNEKNQFLDCSRSFEQFLMDDDAVKQAYADKSITHTLIQGAEKYPDLAGRIVEVAKGFFSRDIDVESNDGNSSVFLNLIKDVPTVATYQDFVWAFRQIREHESSNYSLLFKGFAEYCVLHDNTKEVLKFWDENFPTNKKAKRLLSPNEYAENKSIMREYWDIVVCDDRMFWADDEKFFEDSFPICKDKKTLEEVISRSKTYDDLSFNVLKVSNKIHHFPVWARLTFIFAGVVPALILTYVPLSTLFTILKVIGGIMCAVVFFGSYVLADSRCEWGWSLISIPALFLFLCLIPFNVIVMGIIAAVLLIASLIMFSGGAEGAGTMLFCAIACGILFVGLLG